jgi:hypothetical protein
LIIFIQKTNVMYIIIKYVKNNNDVELPVILLNSHSEILEIETLEEATKMKELFETNSDSGHRYEVKKI